MMEVHKKFDPGDLVEQIPLDSTILGHKWLYLILKFVGKVPSDVSQEKVPLYTYKALVIQEPRLEYHAHGLRSRENQVIMLSVPETPRRFDRAMWKVVSRAEI